MNSILESVISGKPEDIRPPLLYALLNTHCFDGKLPDLKNIKVRWCTAKGHFGQASGTWQFSNNDAHIRYVCDDGNRKDRLNRAISRGEAKLTDFKITINRKAVIRHQNVKRLIETMLHEMCHIEQYMVNDLNAHDRNFVQALDKRIARFNTVFGMDICRQWNMDRTA